MLLYSRRVKDTGSFSPVHSTPAARPDRANDSEGVAGERPPRAWKRDHAPSTELGLPGPLGLPASTGPKNPREEVCSAQPFGATPSRVNGLGREQHSSRGGRHCRLGGYEELSADVAADLAN